MMKALCRSSACQFRFARIGGGDNSLLMRRACPCGVRVLRRTAQRYALGASDQSGRADMCVGCALGCRHAHFQNVLLSLSEWLSFHARLGTF